MFLWLRGSPSLARECACVCMGVCDLGRRWLCGSSRISRKRTCAAHKFCIYATHPWCVLFACCSRCLRLSMRLNWSDSHHHIIRIALQRLSCATVIRWFGGTNINEASYKFRDHLIRAFFIARTHQFGLSGYCKHKAFHLHTNQPQGVKITSSTMDDRIRTSQDIFPTALCAVQMTSFNFSNLRIPKIYWKKNLCKRNLSLIYINRERHEHNM